MKLIIKLNGYLFAVYIVLLLFNGHEGFFVFRILKSFVESVIIMLLGGINLAALFQLLIKRRLDFWETLTVASVFSIVVLPLILSIEYTQTNFIVSWLPIVNSLILFLALLIIYYYNKENARLYLAGFDFKFPNIGKSYLYSVICSFLFWAIALNLLIAWIISHSYYSLPDIDPYYWMSLYISKFNDGELIGLTSDRPLFSSFSYIFNRAAHIDFYAFFKYIIPFFSILPLIPAWLVARKLESKLQAVFTLLLPLVSSSTILYTQMPMPQAMLIILSYYFFFFLIYSWITKQEIFYYIGGFVMLLAFFYHEIAAPIFLIWLIITLIFKRRYLFEKITKNKLASFLIAVIFLLNGSPLLKPFFLIFTWIKRLITESMFRFNFLFPAHYINIDGNLMGWENITGVLKYYLYYVGPAILAIIIITAFFFFKENKFKKYLKTEIVSHKEIIVIFLNFLFFFSISEIAPRFFGIAFLPERAWIFGSIFASLFFFLFFGYFRNRFRIIYVFLVIALYISIGGAIYINNLKKYVVTANHLNSAEWINENLPEQRTIFTTSENKNLLDFYSQSDIVIVPRKFFHDIASYTAEISSYKNLNFNLNERYENYIQTTKNNLNELNRKDPFSQKDTILSILRKNIVESNNIIKMVDSPIKVDKSSPALYIYYARENKKNPYLNRPYYEKIDNQKDEFIFDEYPDKFQRVYFDPEGYIIIWKFL